MLRTRLIGIFIANVVFIGLFIQCSDRSKRIPVKVVTVTDGIANEKIAYLDEDKLEFEILLLGQDESFIVIQQIKKMAWKNGEPNLEAIYIVSDSVSNLDKVDGFTKAREFKNRNEFVEYMSSNDYFLITDNAEKFVFEKR